MEPGSDVNKVESIFLEEKKCGSFCYMYLVKRGGLTLCISRNSIGKPPRLNIKFISLDTMIL